ncbi:MAG: portal protein [Rhabdaerophilum sp.]
MDRQWLLSRHDELRAMRLPEERLWKQIAELIRPDDQDFQGTQRANTAMDDIFDSTPLYALEDFTGGMFGQLTNPANDWFGLGIDDDDLMRYQPVKQWFWAAKQRVRATLGPTMSSFYTEVPSWFADGGAFGIGALYSEEEVGKGRFIDRAIPLREIFIDTDYAARINTVHREFTLSGRQVQQQFPGTPDVKEQNSYQIIHCVHENPDMKPGKLGPEGMGWMSCYVAPELKGLERRAAYYENPYHSITWTRRSGRVYPRGPGHIARADMRTLQEMQKNDLIADQFMSDPMKLVHSEAEFGAADMVPGAVLFGAMADNGKRLMEAFTPNGNIRDRGVEKEQIRTRVREAFYFSMMQLVNRPQMTATEVNAFQEETLRRLAPNLERIQQGGLTPFILRRFSILQRAGALPPPPPELQGRALDVSYLSPLAKVQQMQQARAADQVFARVLQAAQIDPEVVDTLDVDAYVSIAHGASAAPPSLLRSPDAIAERRQARAQQAAQQQQLEQAKQQVEIAATGAHAMQAATLSKGRAA